MPPDDNSPDQTPAPATPAPGGLLHSLATMVGSVVNAADPFKVSSTPAAKAVETKVAPVVAAVKQEAKATITDPKKRADFLMGMVAPGGEGPEGMDFSEMSGKKVKPAAKPEWMPPEGIEKGIPKSEAVPTTIPLDKISVSENAYNRTLSDISKKRGSKTSGPISVFHNPDNGQYLVEDGMHRVVEAHQKGATEIPAKVWSGYSDSIANVRPEEKMDLSKIEDDENEPAEPVSFDSVGGAEVKPSPATPVKEPFSGVHYSPVPVEDTIRGENRGKALAGSEKDRLQYDNKVPGVYAYREGATPEPQIAARGNKYSISGDKAIADIGGAQKQLFQDAHSDAVAKYKAAGDNDTVASQKALNDAEAALHNKGFDGYENKAARPGSVFLFGDQPIGAQKDWADNAADMAAKQGGGFTINPKTGEAPKTGYQIEVGTEQRPPTLDHPATATDIRNVYTQNKALFDQYPELHVGGYGNELNLSANVESLADAKRVAKKLDQISIWDNAKGEEIPTGGTGKRTSFANYPMADRIQDLRGNPQSDVKGFEHLSKDIYDHLEPDERDYLEGDKTLQRNVMSQYHKIEPSVPETTNAMQAGAALGGWWKRYIDVFHDLAGGEAEQTANTIGPSHAEVLKQWHAAVSGNKSVQDANNLAWHSYADWLDAGKPTDRKSIDDIVRKNGAQPAGSGKKGNAAISDTYNKKGKMISPGLDTGKLFLLVNSPEMRSERPFSGDVYRDDTAKNPLMGSTEGARKIPSMGASVAGKGNLNRTVIDAHIRDFYGQGSSGPASQYIADSVHLRQAAKALGLKGGEGQEQLWGTVLGLKSLLKEGLTPEAASGKLNADVINNIGKDYAEIIKNDKEISAPGGILDKLKEKYGIGHGSNGFGEENSTAPSSGPTSKGGPSGSQTSVDKTRLETTAKRIQGTISPRRIKAPAKPTGKVSAVDFLNMLGGLKKPAK